MQPHIAAEDHPNLIRVSLEDETNGLEALHRGWTQQVAAWRLAHGAAVENAREILARTDALIARLEAA